ncbi:hypothetical protein [Sphingomonas sp.]|uniref:hypothetical protein n=1 Tax=Sphingomonas sp. TaxID=28214 RepID=UPI002FC839DB
MSLTMLALLLGSAAAPVQEADPKAAAKEKIVCVDQGETGSRLNKKRVCQTVSQWEQQRKDARDMLDRAHRSQTNAGD